MVVLEKKETDSKRAPLTAAQCENSVLSFAC